MTMSFETFESLNSYGNSTNASHRRKNFRMWVVVMVNWWLAFLPFTLTIQVSIPRKSKAFIM